MRKNITKEDVLNAFDAVGYEIGENALEYVLLKSVGIMPTKVIEWLKSVDKYDDEYFLDTQRCKDGCKGMTDDEIREQKIHDEELHMDAFLNIEYEFADEQFESDYDIGYELAAGFLLSEYCTDEQFKVFMEAMYKENCNEHMLNLPSIKETREKVLGETA